MKSPWYLVLIKAYIQVYTRHMEEEVDEDFGVPADEAYNYHIECRLRRQNLDIRSTFITFTRAWRRYQRIITELERDNVFQMTQSTFDSLYFIDHQIHFVGHAMYDFWVNYIRQFEWVLCQCTMYVHVFI